MATAELCRPTLLSLPPEIRDHIWSDILDKRLQKREEHSFYTIDLTVLRTNKQIHQEAQRVLHRDHTFISIQTPWEQAWDWTRKYGKVPVVAVSKVAETWPPTKLTVRVTLTNELQPAKLQPIILLADDLHQFCLHWFYQELQFLTDAYPGMNCHFMLTLTLRNIENEQEDIPIAKQRQLLEPFGHVKNLSRIEFEGTHADVRHDVASTMKTPARSPTACLEQATRWKDLGNEAISKNKYEEALDLYREAFFAIHVVIDGRQRDCYAEGYFQATLDKRVDGSVNGNVVYFKMRVRLVANVMQAYVHLEQWEEVRFWGMRSIDLIRDIAGQLADQPNENIPGPESWGKIYYRTALANEQIGDMSEARELYRVALVWLPNYKGAREAVERTKLRLG